MALTDPLIRRIPGRALVFQVFEVEGVHRVTVSAGCFHCETCGSDDCRPANRCSVIVAQAEAVAQRAREAAAHGATH